VCTALAQTSIRWYSGQRVLDTRTDPMVLVTLSLRGGGVLTLVRVYADTIMGQRIPLLAL